MKKEKKQGRKIVSQKPAPQKKSKENQEGKVQNSKMPVDISLLLAKYPPLVWEEPTLMKAKNSGYFREPLEIAAIGRREMKNRRAQNSSARHMDFFVHLSQSCESGSLLDTLHLIRDAHKCQIYPPPRVMEWLAKGIDLFLKNKGKKRLEECLGLIGERSQSNIFSKQQNADRDFRLCMYMQVLRHIGKLSIEKAAYLVAQRSDSLCSEEIVKRYKLNPFWKNTRKVFQSSADIPDIVLWRFMQEFAYEDLPLPLRPYHPSHPSVSN